jgi:hypothetical protein
MVPGMRETSDKVHEVAAHRKVKHIVVPNELHTERIFNHFRQRRF